MDAPADAVPAATVVPLRDGRDGLEVLMLRKNSRLAFGGMWVFPGGRVEPDDAQPGEAVDGLDAARRAAVREAEEEAGILLPEESLVPFSHWTPPGAAPRRYNTWFFLAPVREAVEVVIDMGEIHDHGWLTPRAAIGRRDAGEYELAPPTWMTLWRLSGSGGVDAALADAGGALPVERFTTRIVADGSALVAVWAGDAAYDTGDLAAPGGRRRLIMADSWRYDGA